MGLHEIVGAQWKVVWTVKFLKPRNMERVGCRIRRGVESSTKSMNILLSKLCRLGRVNEAKWHFKSSGHDLGSEAMQRLLQLEVHLMNMQKARELQDWDRVLQESTLSIEAGVDASHQVIAAKAESLVKLHKAKEALKFLMAAKNSEESKSRKASEEVQNLLIIETKINLYLGR